MTETFPAPHLLGNTFLALGSSLPFLFQFSPRVFTKPFWRKIHPEFLAAKNLGFKKFLKTQKARPNSRPETFSKNPRWWMFFRNLFVSFVGNFWSFILLGSSPGFQRFQNQSLTTSISCWKKGLWIQTRSFSQRVGLPLKAMMGLEDLEALSWPGFRPNFQGRSVKLQVGIPWGISRCCFFLLPTSTPANRATSTLPHPEKMGGLKLLPSARILTRHHISVVVLDVFSWEKSRP